MKVAILNNSGFCIGGTNTLCFEYAKLGFDVFVRNRFRHGFHTSKFPDHIFIYSSIPELVELLQDYDRILTVDLWGGGYGYDKMFDDFIAIRNNLPHLELCHIHCQRDISTWSQVLKVCNAKNFKFSHVFSLNPMITRYADSTVININAFTFSDINWIDVRNKRNIVFSAGRVEEIKGINKYINAVNLEFLHKSDDFIYLHEGVKFSINRGQIKCRIKDLFDSEGIKKNWIEFKQYTQYPNKEKFNIYPVYNIDDIYNRWKYYYAGICCVLGIQSGYTNNNSLLGRDRIIANEAEKQYIEKFSRYWNTSLEYTEMEKIALGVPVLFSRPYSKILGFNDERLIYDKFLDIPDKVEALISCYDSVRNTQFNWLANRLKNINENIIKQFTRNF